MLQGKKVVHCLLVLPNALMNVNKLNQHFKNVDKKPTPYFPNIYTGNIWVQGIRLVFPELH